MTTHIPHLIVNRAAISDRRSHDALEQVFICGAIALCHKMPHTILKAQLNRQAASDFGSRQATPIRDWGRPS